jgi:hypothetical protein
LLAGWRNIFATVSVLTIMALIELPRARGEFPGRVRQQRMFFRITNAARLRSAVVLALVHLLCVLAPDASFAFGDGSRAAHCLTDNHHGLSAGHVSKRDVAKAHVHEDGGIHDHAKAGDDQNNASDSQCCGLVCLSALPASEIVVQTPTRLTAVTVSLNQDDVTGNSPDRLYRPPISLLSH